ncbi:hypothetical protein MAPG_09989 [Magnaporthiopsis poae ATCC 64411]|uniref:Uncharacterized protein n=1 Tax=Magnaporthiopsis poae (strain ATCC 64411 / 73-15) TaxID=644358 RepID=A0A0C4EBE1_MAGP6|nr:hypothetical protein MAPG_09989 [Magnaporthiopsis poae ATCC 64411]
MIVDELVENLWTELGDAAKRLLEHKKRERPLELQFYHFRTERKDESTTKIYTRFRVDAYLRGCEGTLGKTTATRHLD